MLELCVQYLYVLYCDQSEIGNYDFMLLQLDYIGLFCDCIYSGLDCIVLVNQVIIGFILCVYDVVVVECFNIFVG